MINFDDFKGFKKDQVAYDDYTICYASITDSLEKAKAYYNCFSGGKDLIEKYSPTLEESESITGIELNLQIANETGDVALFTYTPVIVDQDGDPAFTDGKDLKLYESADVITFMKKCDVSEDLIKKVEEKL